MQNCLVPEVSAYKVRALINLRGTCPCNRTTQYTLEHGGPLTDQNYCNNVVPCVPHLGLIAGCQRLGLTPPP
jgi:hypothetical protein